MGGCAVPNCKSRTERNKNNLSFHRFPVSKLLQEIWIRSLNMPNAWVPYRSTRICSNHFEETSFTIVGKRKKLTNDACPKIMVPKGSTKRELEMVPKGQTKRKLEMEPEENRLRKRKKVEEVKETQKNRKLKQNVQKLKKLVINLKCVNNNLKDLARSRGKKVANLNKKCKRLKKKVASLKQIIQEITNEKLIKEELFEELKSLGDESDVIMK